MLIDNVNTKEIKWSDFELEGNNENLISQGWNSFEPYGFGEFIEKAPEEVFDENYAQNILRNGNFADSEYWQIVPTESDTNIQEKRVEIRSGGSLGTLQQAGNEKVKINDLYYLRLTISNYNSGNISFAPYYYNVIERDGFNKNGTQSALYTYNRPIYGAVVTHVSNTNLDIDCIYVVNLTEHFGLGNEPTKEWCDENLKYYPNWQDLTEEDKPVDAYENGFIYIQEFNSGLMRVRTKGGSDETKLISPNLGTLAGLGTDLTLSLYAENSGESDINLSNNNSIEGVPYPSGDNHTITLPINHNGGAYLKGVSKGTDVELSVSSVGDIDMVVSNPEIVLGNVQNAVMFIDELEDGREHVQIHNINANTKLAYTDDSTIKGEPYTIETKIENDGRVFNLVANMLDDKVEVKKGLNAINEFGELKDKDLKIEVEVD